MYLDPNTSLSNVVASNDTLWEISTTGKGSCSMGCDPRCSDYQQQMHKLYYKLRNWWLYLLMVPYFWRILNVILTQIYNNKIYINLAIILFKMYSILWDRKHYYILRCTYTYLTWCICVYCDLTSRVYKQKGVAGKIDYIDVCLRSYRSCQTPCQGHYTIWLCTCNNCQ